MQSLGAFLRYSRKSKGITQEELASEMHVVSPVISKWENGKSVPDLAMLCRLCNILNISLEECVAQSKLEEPSVLPPIDYDSQKLGEKLKDLRIKNNLSQSDVGMKLFVTSQTISRWESGGMTSLENLQSICNFYGISPTRLMSEDLALPSNSQVNISTNTITQTKAISAKSNFNLKKKLFVAIAVILIVILGAITAIVLRPNTNAEDQPHDIKFECIAPLDEYTFGRVFFLEPSYDPTNQLYTLHKAVDFNAPAGSLVRCIFDGVVKMVVSGDYSGTVVYVEHIDGFVSVYKPLKESDLQIGDIVAKGDVIGKLASAEAKEFLEESLSGDHLHLELYKDDELVDPLEYMPDVEKPPEDYIKNFQ